MKNSDVSADQILFSLIGVARGLEGRLEEALGGVGLSLSKLGVLTHLVQAGKPLPLSELASRLSCVRSNITQLVDRLEGEGLVRRVDDPQDRRSVLAEVTPLGLERQAAGIREKDRIRNEFAASLSDADRSSLGRVLAELL